MTHRTNPNATIHHNLSQSQLPNGGGEDMPQSLLDSDELDSDTLDLEIALLATTAGQDAGEPTETVDLATLSHTEKQALLALLRRNLGVSEAKEAGK